MPTLVRERLRAPRTFIPPSRPVRPVKIDDEPAAPHVSRYVNTKSLLSPLVGVLLAIPCLPIIAVLYALIRLTSPGPGFYRQVRSGINGRRFTI